MLAETLLSWRRPYANLTSLWAALGLSLLCVGATYAQERAVPPKGFSNWAEREAAIYVAGIRAVVDPDDTINVVETVHWGDAMSRVFPPLPLGPVPSSLWSHAVAARYSVRLLALNEALDEHGNPRVAGPIVVLGPLDFFDADTVMFRLALAKGMGLYSQYRFVVRRMNGTWVVVEKMVEIEP
jgi:hypothetical protein